MAKICELSLQFVSLCLLSASHKLLTNSCYTELYSPANNIMLRGGGGLPALCSSLAREAESA